MTEEQVQAAWATIRQAIADDQPEPPHAIFAILEDMHMCLRKIAGAK